MKHNECLVCKSKKIKPLNNYKKDYLCKCVMCGFVFCEIVPSLEELTSFYSSYGVNHYLSEITVKRYNELLDSFEPFRKTNKILDVGCGSGFFLCEAKKRGWDVFGTEFSNDLFDICKNKGINMHKGKLNPQNYLQGSFDVITSFEVIEHINNPNEEVNNFKILLRKGGLFYFTTPNFNALERFYLKEKYNVINYPEHLSYYTKKTINKLLSKNGFNKKKLITTGISLTRIKNSKSNKNKETVQENNTDDKLRKATESGFGTVLKKSVNFLLNFFSVGNSLKGYYIKN